MLQLSRVITFDSGIETTIIIYQIEARTKLHNVIWSRQESHFYTQIQSFTSLTHGLKVLTHHFHFTYFRFLFNRAIKEILVPTWGCLFVYSISLYSSKSLR